MMGSQVQNKKIAEEICKSLTLRKPQAESLIRLDHILSLIDLGKKDEAKEIILRHYGDMPNTDFSDFERNFISMCYAIATGVGKTRLMGAFLAYLFLTGRSRNFFVIAPNKIIHDKLIQDFTPTSRTYVLKGLANFASHPPIVVTPDNFETAYGQSDNDLFGRGAAFINIFNIDSMNTYDRRIRQFNEFIGESYFDHLSSLDDLVIFMDEAHRYLGDAGFNSIEDLKPTLGVELTATPLKRGSKKKLKNIVFEYGLAQAISDGFVKVPAVASRENFDPSKYSSEEIENIKIKDGVQYHRMVQQSLEDYSRVSGESIVKPFILIVASDTAHASKIMDKVTSLDFFDGYFKNKTIEIHSKNSKDIGDVNREKLENIDRGIGVEIIIHVDKLREGWDVKNLFTIIPLRASDSNILTEQTIGRGLRLPYGRRTGVPEIDRLTIIAHENFDRIVSQARKGGIESFLDQVTASEDGDFSKNETTILNRPIYEVRAAESMPDIGQDLMNAAAIAVSQKIDHVEDISDLRKSDIQDQIVTSITSDGTSNQKHNPEDIAKAVSALCRSAVEDSISIPKISIIPIGGTDFSFRNDIVIDFSIDDNGLVISDLVDGKKNFISISSDETGDGVALIYDLLDDYPEINTAMDRDVIEPLIEQIKASIQRRYPSADISAMLYKNGALVAAEIAKVMKQNMSRNTVINRVVVERRVTTLKPQEMRSSGGDRNFRDRPESLSDIKSMVFTGFRKNLYQRARFDSNPERIMSCILEDDQSVLRWLKPAKNQFRIYDHRHKVYNPDFIVEMDDRYLIIETKRQDEVDTDEVQAKADAAAVWCHFASQASLKPWSYILVPEKNLNETTTLSGLVRVFSRPLPSDVWEKYQQ